MAMAMHMMHIYILPVLIHMPELAPLEFRESHPTLPPWRDGCQSHHMLGGTAQSVSECYS